MLTLQQYLNESLALTEAIIDNRRNPPKFTDKQQKTNGKLLQHVISTFDNDRYRRRKTAWRYAVAYGIAGNKNYRTSILSRPVQVHRDGYDYGPLQPSGIEIITDSTTNTVSIIARIDLCGKETNKENKQTIKEISKLIEAGLKQIAKSVKVTKINSGSQFGYTYQMTDVDYDKCKKSFARIQTFKVETNRDVKDDETEQ